MKSIITKLLFFLVLLSTSVAYAEGGNLISESYTPNNSNSLIFIQGMSGGNGKANYQHNNSNSEEKASVVSSAGEKAWDFIKLLKVKPIALVLGGIFCILCLTSFFLRIKLYLYPNMRKPKDSDKEYLKRCLQNLKTRIALFSSLYACILFLSFCFIVFLLYTTIYLIVGLCYGWIVFAFILSYLSIAIDLFIIMMIGGLWMGSITLFLTLLKPIYRFKRLKDIKEKYYELHPTDAPELYDFIKTTCIECGVDVPNKILVSLDANACVTFINPLNGIKDCQSTKVLCIGMPLILNLSVQELKAIIAHECGHVAQPTTSNTTAVAILAQRINSLLEFDEYESLKYDKWLSSEHTAWRLAGKITYISIQKISYLLLELFRKVVSVSNDMRRQMELDADKLSAKVAGSEYAASSQYKIPVILSLVNTFKSFLTIGLTQKSILPDRLLSVFLDMKPFILKGINVDYNDGIIAKAPLITKTQSRIEIINEWETHPDEKKRLDVIQGVNSHPLRVDSRSGKSLLTRKLIESFENHFIASISQNNIKILSTEEYSAWIVKEYKDRSYPSNLEPLFNRNIVIRKNNWPQSGNPLTKDDFDNFIEVLREYSQAVNDLEQLILFVNGSSGRSRIKYMGKEYNRKRVPLESHKKYVNDLFRKVQDNDMAIMAHAISCVDDPDDVRSKYRAIQYAQDLLEELHKEFDNHLSWLHSFLMSPGFLSAEESISLHYHIQSIGKRLKQFLNKKIDYKYVAPVVHSELAKRIQEFSNSEVKILDINDHPHMMEYFEYFELAESILNDVIYLNAKNIALIIEGQPTEKYWKNSLASKMN